MCDTDQDKNVEDHEEALDEAEEAGGHGGVMPAAALTRLLAPPPARRHRAHIHLFRAAD